jgi:CheY-like chemotaxis protein
MLSDTPDASTAVRDEPARPDRAPRILVVCEDPRAQRTTLLELLGAGVQVDWASDADGALARVTCSAPDAILVESRRSVGVEHLLARLASSLETARVPIILRTPDPVSASLREHCVAVVRGPNVGDVVAVLYAIAVPRPA